MKNISLVLLTVALFFACSSPERSTPPPPTNMLSPGQMIEAAEKKNWSLIYTAAEMGSSVNVTEGQHGWTLLHYAVRDDNKVAVKKLLKYGAKINKSMKAGLTPTDVAIQNMNWEMVNLLESKGGKCKVWCVLREDAVKRGELDNPK